MVIVEQVDTFIDVQSTSLKTFPGASIANKKGERRKGMEEKIPRTVSRDLTFENGKAIGISNRWNKGQYCSILTKAGIVGCGIYDIPTAAEFDMAVAIAKGTPENPLVEPEDLFNAKIVNLTPKAKDYGIEIGMTGKQAVELMLQA
jgi:uncharacterized protein YunC (DUF1805 family)